MKLEGDLTLPNDYAEMIGRIVEAWAHFEFEVDIAIWQILGTPDQLAACVTSQLSSMHPRFNAFIALAQVHGTNQRTIKKLKTFVSKRVGGLIERRNRSAHDPRMVKTDNKEVNRLSISARNGNVSFEFVPEPIDSLKKTYNEIFSTIRDFIELRREVLGEVEAIRTNGPQNFLSISQKY
jgi:hypothetical protein